MILRLVIASVIIFFLPGFTLVNAVFPRKGELDKEYDIIYRIALSIPLSASLVILLGFIFGISRPIFGVGGYFKALNIWISLLCITGILFILGWYRGGYSLLKKIHPKLDKEKSKYIEKKEDLDDSPLIEALENLFLEKNKVLYELKEVKKKRKKAPMKKSKFYERKIKRLEEQIKNIDNRMKKLEERREEEIY